MEASIRKLKRFLSEETQISADNIRIDASLITRKTIKKNRYLLTEGQVCNFIAYVVSGMFRSYYLKNGNEIITSFFKENTLACSFNSLVNRIPSVEFIEALEDSDVLLLSYKNLNILYKTDSQWQLISRILTEKECIYLANRVSFLNFESAKIKYIHLLKEDPDLIKRVPVQHIASYIGVSRETLSRIRSHINFVT